MTDLVGQEMELDHDTMTGDRARLTRWGGRLNSTVLLEWETELNHAAMMGDKAQPHYCVRRQNLTVR